MSATIHVPADQPSIQAGIDAAVNGDTVLVAPGRYLENIDFTGKAITVMSSEGPPYTTIHTKGTGTVVSFHSNEGNDSVLQGFSITGGGRGIYCGKLNSPSSPTIIGNHIFGNSGYGPGAGIFVEGSSPTVEDNVIFSNYSVSNGGGIQVSYHSSPLIRRNWIYSNSTGKGDGGGIKIWILQAWPGNPIIENNIIACNVANDKGGGLFVFNPMGKTLIKNNLIIYNEAYGADAAIECRGPGGGIYTEESFTIISNNTICFNYAESPLSIIVAAGLGCSEDLYISKVEIFNNIITSNLHGAGIMCQHNVVPTITFNDVWQNEGGDYIGCCAGAGDISEDPLFVQSGRDFHLTYPSPCKDTGDNTAVTELYDFEGDPRIAYGTVDMGADEFYMHLYYTGDTTPGGSAALKFVGDPGTAQVGLMIW